MLKQFLYLIGMVMLAQCSNPPDKPEIPRIGNRDERCCTKDTAGSEVKVRLTSEITCPRCGHKKTETMPTDVCLIRYNCEKCGTGLTPENGDCCVFCSYGTHKCPSMQ